MLVLVIRLAALKWNLALPMFLPRETRDGDAG